MVAVPHHTVLSDDTDSRCTRTLVGGQTFVTLFFGGVLVGVQVRTLYSTPLLEGGASWFADEMKLRHLTGRRQFSAKYLSYVTPFLFLQLSLSVLPEILNLWRGIAGTTATVGTLTLSGSDVQLLAPLLPATAVSR